MQIDGEMAEAVSEVLSRYAYHQGVAIEASPEGVEASPVTVRAYLPVDDRIAQVRRQVEEAVWHLSQIRPLPEPTFRLVAETDWSEAWKTHMDVIHVGERIVIRPSWLDYLPADDEILVELDPGMAFGTGLHPTTQMCLQGLERNLQEGDTVLDLGTGSGILAIVAARMEADRVDAYDIDPVAVEVARANFAVNDVVERIVVEEGSLGQVAGRYDVVVVNILARVILQMLDQGLADCLRDDGCLILAGILDEQEGDVKAALEREGLTLQGRQQIADWVCLMAQPS